MIQGDQGAKRFCTECGAELGAGDAFCMDCGTPIPSEQLAHGGVVTEEMPAVREASPQQGTVPTVVPAVMTAAAAGAPAGPTAASSKKTLIAIIVAAAAVVALIIVLVVAFVLPKPVQEVPVEDAVTEEVADDPDDEAALKEDADDAPLPADVALPYSYSTQFEQVNKVSYPTFTFRYPERWEIADAKVQASSEEVTLRRQKSDVAVRFIHQGSGDSAMSVYPTSVKKVADSDFWPMYAQAADYRSVGASMVAEVTLEPVRDNGDDLSWSYYAVLPERAASSGGDRIEVVSSVPGFEYGGVIAFTCEIPEGGMDATIRSEVIAILSSFSNGTTEDEYETAAALARAANIDYILPDSDSRFYSEGELRAMDLHDLYLARNEIFARHGRIFKNDDLRAYFDRLDWYHGSVAPEDFSETVFNEYEKKNAALMLEIEQSQGSPYLNP